MQEATDDFTQACTRKESKEYVKRRYLSESRSHHVETVENGGERGGFFNHSGNIMHMTDSKE